MYSEFYNVELDRVRYSLVWEDSETLYKALDIVPEDHVLLITSAGCNVLNALLKQPASVTAIDLNAVQNNMLLFKMHLIQHHNYPCYRSLLGLDGAEAVAYAWNHLQPSLPEEMSAYWASFFESHPQGLLSAGKLENYLHGFFPLLDHSIKEKLKQIIEFDSVEEQSRFFMNELHGTVFQQQFISYFDEANLSKGRDPKLFKYTEDSGGQSFYERLVQQVSRVLVKDNFYFRFFFWGPEGLPDPILPPCYQEKHFALLKSQLEKVKIVHSEAINYLLSPEGAQINKASLSNIFEYTSQQEFEDVYTKLFSTTRSPVRVVFWNLLQNQGASLTYDPWLNPELSSSLSYTDACFYFRNVRVQSTCSATFTHNQNSAMPASHHFTPAYIERIMCQYTPQESIRVTDVRSLPVDSSASILAALTAGRTEKIIGHYGLEVTYEKNGGKHTRHMVMKIKPHGDDIVNMLQALADGCGGELPAIYHEYKHLTGFQHTHMRELEVYGKLTNDLYPEIFGLEADHENDVYVILMEYLEDVELLNTVMAPKQWTNEHIFAALRQIAHWHAANLEKDNTLDKRYWSDAPSKAYMTQLTPLWKALLQNATRHFPDLYTSERNDVLNKAIEHIPAYWEELEQMPKTVIHNDLNPRNSCFKMKGEELQFCVYDWELSTWHVPQYDVVELLSFVLEEDRYHLCGEFIAFYQDCMHTLTGRFDDENLFMRGLELAAYDFGIHRLGMYMMAHTVSPYPFLPRVVKSYFNVLEWAQTKDLPKKAYLADS